MKLPAGKGICGYFGLIPPKDYMQINLRQYIETENGIKSVEGAISQIKEEEIIVDALKDYQGNLLLVAVNYDKNTKSIAARLRS